LGLIIRAITDITFAGVALANIAVFYFLSWRLGGKECSRIVLIEL
jgi:hypothetical protein